MTDGSKWPQSEQQQQIENKFMYLLMNKKPFKFKVAADLARTNIDLSVFEQGI